MRKVRKNKVECTVKLQGKDPNDMTKVVDGIKSGAKKHKIKILTIFRETPFKLIF